MSTERVALISVSHKDGIVDFAQSLIRLGFRIYASDGTSKHLADSGIEAPLLSSLFNKESISGQGVATLPREVLAGLISGCLAATDVIEDTTQSMKLGIPYIDLVCVDFRPLTEVGDESRAYESVIRQIDAGGPSMVRSAVKGGRIVVCDPLDRQRVIDWLDSEEPSKGLFQELAAKAEFMVAQHCMASATYLSKGEYTGLLGKRVATCAYGENPYQEPAHLFTFQEKGPFAPGSFKVIAGTPRSYNNIADIDRLLLTTSHAVATHVQNFTIGSSIAFIVKHGNACGGSMGEDSSDVLLKAVRGNERALMGGSAMVNFDITEKHAGLLVGRRLDAIVAPGFASEAVEMLQRKGDKCRFVVNQALAGRGATMDHATRFRNVRDGFATQPNYTFAPTLSDVSIEKYGTAAPRQRDNMLLAWAICATSNSNTITLVKDGMLIGNGVGQQDRVGAAELAIKRARDAGHDVMGSVACSDAFFPHPDGVEELIKAGVKAILTVSGSIRDQAIIDVCQQNNIVLYMMKNRCFFGH